MRSKSRVRVETLERRDLLSTFTVTNNADAGAGSFRQAILDNDATPGLNAIDFNIPGGGVHTIALASALPAINNPAIVDATTQPGYNGTPLVELNGANIYLPGVMPPTLQFDVTGLVLSGGATTVKGFTIDRFTGTGIYAPGDGNSIAANFIGTDTTGTRSSGNGGVGIYLSSRNNVIGGTASGSRNLISGNQGQGIFLGTSGGLPSNNVVEGNLIGTDAGGTNDVGNAGAGVAVESSSNVIGGSTPIASNTIAFNGGAGVQVGYYAFESGVTRNRIVGNSIFNNIGLGIDLGNDGVTFNIPGGANFGPNLLQNFPTLTSAYTATGGGTTVEGSLNATPNSTFTINYYASPLADPTGFGQGQTPIGSQVSTTDATGNVDITTTLPASVPLNEVISATATDSRGNTSEFSRSLAVKASSQADLSLTAFSNSSAQANVAQTVTFTVLNNGPSSASGIVFTDILPLGATFLSGNSSQGFVDQTSGIVTAQLGVLASGASSTITLTFSVPTAGTSTNRATVRADQFDPSPSNNTVTQDIQVAPSPPTDLAVYITAAPEPAQVGRGFTYVLLVANNGPGSASGVTLTNDLPDAASILSITPTQGTYSLIRTTLTAAIGDLVPGQVAAVTVVLRPGAPGLIVDQATVSGDQTDYLIGNNYSELATVVVADQSAPVILNERLNVSNKRIPNVVLTFNKALDPTLASNLANYAIYDLGSNGTLSSNGPAVRLASAVYNSTSRSVTITPRGALSVGRFYKLVVDGPGAPGIEDTFGNVLDGAGNGTQDSIFESLIGRGTATRPSALQSGGSASHTSVKAASGKAKVHTAAPHPKVVHAKATHAVPKGRGHA